MCDEGKDRFFWGGGAENFLPEKGAAGQISLRSTDCRVSVGLKSRFWGEQNVVRKV